MSQEKDVRLEDVAANKAELDDKARKMLEDILNFYNKDAYNP